MNARLLIPLLTVIAACERGPSPLPTPGYYLSDGRIQQSIQVALPDSLPELPPQAISESVRLRMHRERRAASRRPECTRYFDAGQGRVFAVFTLRCPAPDWNAPDGIAMGVFSNRGEVLGAGVTLAYGRAICPPYRDSAGRAAVWTLASIADSLVPQCPTSTVRNAIRDTI